jgi:hypothetical protein
MSDGVKLFIAWLIFSVVVFGIAAAWDILSKGCA